MLRFAKTEKPGRHHTCARTAQQVLFATNTLNLRSSRRLEKVVDIHTKETFHD